MDQTKIHFVLSRMTLSRFSPSLQETGPSRKRRVSNIASHAGPNSSSYTGQHVISVEPCQDVPKQCNSRHDAKLKAIYVAVCSKTRIREQPKHSTWINESQDLSTPTWVYPLHGVSGLSLHA